MKRNTTKTKSKKNSTTIDPLVIVTRNFINEQEGCKYVFMQVHEADPEGTNNRLWVDTNEAVVISSGVIRDVQFLSAHADNCPITKDKRPLANFGCYVVALGRLESHSIIAGNRVDKPDGAHEIRFQWNGFHKVKNPTALSPLNPMDDGLVLTAATLTIGANGLFVEGELTT